MSPFERLMLQKRREVNRLSAKRCRKRRRDEIKQMEEEIRRLQYETEQLEAEKASLTSELQQEIAMATSGNSVGGGANPQEHLLPQADTTTPMLPWLVQQRQRTQNFLPSDRAHMGHSIAALYSTSAGLGNAFRHEGDVQNAAISHQSLGPTTRSVPSSPLDVLNYLSLWQARNGVASTMPPLQAPWVIPQALALSNSVDNPYSAITSLHATLPGTRELVESSHGNDQIASPTTTTTNDVAINRDTNYEQVNGVETIYRYVSANKPPEVLKNGKTNRKDHAPR